MGTEARVETLTKSDIKGRGWTYAAIRNLLGLLDKTKPNPYSKRAAPMQLWAKEKVVAAEETEEFQRWKEASEGKRKNQSEMIPAKHAVIREESIAWAKGMETQVKRIESEKYLRKRGCRN